MTGLDLCDQIVLSEQACGGNKVKRTAAVAQELGRVKRASCLE